jgi:hypothetical protein
MAKYKRSANKNIIMKTETPLEKLNKQIENDALRLYNVSNSVCDHKVRTADGMVVSFRNTCEVCGNNMRAK